MAVEPPVEHGEGKRGFPVFRRMLGNAYYKAKFEKHGAGPAMTERIQAMMESFSGRYAAIQFQRDGKAAPGVP